MQGDVYKEAFRLASTIRDKYLRAVTYAKIGYYAYRGKNALYRDAFKYALNAAGSIDNPVLLAKALIEIGTYLSKVNSKTFRKTFHQAYELVLTFPQPMKDDLLEAIATRLLELGVPDDALFYASDIEDDVKRNDLLLKILRVYLREGKMRKAALIVKQIKDEPWHSIGALETVKTHLKREEFGSTIRVLSEIKSDYWLGEAMKEVAIYLKNSDVPRATYEKFVDIALGMSTETGFDVLRSLLIGLAVQGELGFVMDIIGRLPDEQRANILEGVARAVADKAEVLSELVDAVEGEEFEDVARIVMDKLLERTVSEEYVPIVTRIGEKTSDDATVVKVVTYLAKAGEFEKAWEFAQRVRGNYLRSLAFGSIAVARLKNGDIDGAIDAALEVKDVRWGSWLLSEILTKVLELQTEGRLSEDIEERARHQRALWDRG